LKLEIEGFDYRIEFSTQIYCSTRFKTSINLPSIHF